MMSRLPLPDGQSIAYVDDGAEADALVLLHGGGLDRRLWGPQLDAFPGHRVIAPDARGHGDSSTPDAPFRLVDDVVALLDGLGLGRVVMVGLSMGGGTAIDLAVEAPERVRGLVVSGTGTSDPDFRDPWVLDVFATWRRAVDEQDPELWVQGFERFVPGPHRDLEQVDPGVVALNDAMVRHTLDTHVLPVVARGALPIPPTRIAEVNRRRAAIAVPTLAITGGADADDHRRITRELIDAVPHGREVVVPGTAHYPNLEAPERFNDALAGFLRELDG